MKIFESQIKDKEKVWKTLVEEEKQCMDWLEKVKEELKLCWEFLDKNEHETEQLVGLKKKREK